MRVLQRESRVPWVRCISTGSATQSIQNPSSSGMAKTQQRQGCQEFLGIGQFLQNICAEFQFEGQATDRVDKGQDGLALGRAARDIFQGIKTQFGKCTGIAYA